METVYRVLLDRAERGMADLLLSVADHCYSLGAGIPSEAATYPGLADLFALLESRHRDEVLALRGLLDAPIAHDDLPGWLLRQQQQVAK
jgi:hypothetical protein